MQVGEQHAQEPKNGAAFPSYAMELAAHWAVRRTFHLSHSRHISVKCCSQLWRPRILMVYMFYFGLALVLCPQKEQPTYICDLCRAESSLIPENPPPLLWLLFVQAPLRSTPLAQNDFLWIKSVFKVPARDILEKYWKSCVSKWANKNILYILSHMRLYT